MIELLDDLERWSSDSVAVGRAVVVRTFGSAPRPEGAVLLVADDGRISGSVSGGCVEGAAAEEVAQARRTGRSRVIRYGISDEQAWDVGLACGGTIDVLVEPTVRPELGRAGRALGRAVVIPLPADAPGPEFGQVPPGEGAEPAAPLVVGEDGSLSGSTGDVAIDAELVSEASRLLNAGRSKTVEIARRSFFVEVYPRRPRLVIVGAVQVAIPLVALAHTLGYETVVVDGRAAFATRERFPDAGELIVGWPDEVADAIGLGPSDAVAVLTHDVKFDEPAMVEALARGCRYVGAVGSRKTQGDRRERLSQVGVSEDALDRLHGPIGLDLGGRNPAETALAIMAEVIADRYGADGGHLRSRRVAAQAR